MADLKISELPVLSGPDLEADDDIAIADYSASETKRLTAKNLVQSGVDLIDAGSINGVKLEDATVGGSDKLIDGSVTEPKLGDSSVSDRTIVSDAVKTVHITDGNVTNEKLATGIDGQKINDGSLQGSAIVDGSITQDKYGPQSIDEAALAEDAVTGEKLAPLTNRGLDQTGDLIGITNDTGAPSTTISGITFDQQGLINSATELVATDLPEATVDDIGAIKPGTGLSVTGDGTLNHSNVIAANDIGGLTFDEEGHCTGFPAGTPPVFERDAIPLAGDESTEVGGVFVPRN